MIVLFFLSSNPAFWHVPTTLFLRSLYINNILRDRVGHLGNRTESQRIKSKWKKSQKIIPKKSERKKVRKSCIANIFAGKKVMTFFPMLSLETFLHRFGHLPWDETKFFIFDKIFRRRNSKTKSFRTCFRTKIKDGGNIVPHYGTKLKTMGRRLKFLGRCPALSSDRSGFIKGWNNNMNINISKRIYVYILQV